MTTRMGRIVDRTRALAGQARAATGAERAHIENQLTIMFRRAKLMRLSMTLTASSMFTSGLLIMLLFVSGIFGVAMPAVILGVFALSVAFMLAGLAAFIRDVFLSLQALSFEVARALRHDD
jgi:small-conductance mechanosensitive channel